MCVVNNEWAICALAIIVLSDKDAEAMSQMHDDGNAWIPQLPIHQHTWEQTCFTGVPLSVKHMLKLTPV